MWKSKPVAIVALFSPTNLLSAMLKTPIAYYGGKIKMASSIIALMPEHQAYIEPFFGGGAVFWAKNPSEHEVVNDLNHHLITFYQVLKHRFDELGLLLDETFHSRVQHAYAKQVYRDNTIDDDVLKAWAVFVQTNSSFANKIAGGYKFDRLGKCSKAYMSKIKQFTEWYRDRLQKVNIECNDALKVIQSYDSTQALVYCDPPYMNCNQGHYAGYTGEDYGRLLAVLSKLKGKFILSSYPDPILDSFVRRLGWRQIMKEYPISVNNRQGSVTKMKTEVLTLNY